MKILTLVAALSVSALAWAGAPATPPAKKSTATRAVAAKKPATVAALSTVKKPAVTARKPAVVTAATQKGKKAAPVRSTTTWRNRQTTPTQDRYKEIQDALVAKGYLSSEEANGTWGQSSADALKNFQAEQTLESTGKINSLSLIALGLGPKHDSVSTLPVDGNYAQPESGKN